MQKLLIVVIIMLLNHPIMAQFPPPAGEPGTTAMFKDSTAFRAWASGCTVEIGYINFVDTTVTYGGSNRADFGLPEYATDTADNLVITLGDRGIATLTLPAPMYDSAGPDFAVFENSFGEGFLELAYVEVSSDGQHFVRFPAISLTAEFPQVPTFGKLDATKIHNFAGKYRVFYGTPFDLSDIKDSSGIELNAVTHIRILDVGGCIDPGYQSFDSEGHIVNDPWPTPFHTCGFDLDAIGIIHIESQAIFNQNNAVPIRVFPNPVHHKLNIRSESFSIIRLTLKDIFGKLYLTDHPIQKMAEIDMSDYPGGIYFAIFTTQDGTTSVRKIIKK